MIVLVLALALSPISIYYRIPNGDSPSTFLSNYTPESTSRSPALTRSRSHSIPVSPDLALSRSRSHPIPLSPLRLILTLSPAPASFSRRQIFPTSGRDLFPPQRSRAVVVRWAGADSRPSTGHSARALGHHAGAGSRGHRPEGAQGQDEGRHRGQTGATLLRSLRRRHEAVAASIHSRPVAQG